MSGDWIEWKGGECPVDGDAKVDIRMRFNLELPRTHARFLNWEHGSAMGGTAGDIIAYRLSSPSAEVRPGEQ